MQTFLIVLVVIAACQLLHDHIIRPLIQMQEHFRLFAMRDELRRLYALKKLTRLEFLVFQSGVNATIRLVPTVGMATFWRAHTAFDDDEAFQARLARRQEVYANCKCERALELKRASSNILLRSLAVNSLWFFLVATPIVLIGILLNERLIPYLKSLRQTFAKLEWISEPEVVVVALGDS